MRSLNIAATGMLAQQQNVEVISNNIANMNTTGFMRRRTEFQDLIYQNLRRIILQMGWMKQLKKQRKTIYQNQIVMINKIIKRPITPLEEFEIASNKA